VRLRLRKQGRVQRLIPHEIGKDFTMRKEKRDTAPVQRVTHKGKAWPFEKVEKEQKYASWNEACE
jgi:hypothetical protein